MSFTTIDEQAVFLIENIPTELRSDENLTAFITSLEVELNVKLPNILLLPVNDYGERARSVRANISSEDGSTTITIRTNGIDLQQYPLQEVDFENFMLSFNNTLKKFHKIIHENFTIIALGFVSNYVDPDPLIAEKMEELINPSIKNGMNIKSSTNEVRNLFIGIKDEVIIQGKRYPINHNYEIKKLKNTDTGNKGLGVSIDINNIDGSKELNAHNLFNDLIDEVGKMKKKKLSDVANTLNGL